MMPTYRAVVLGVCVALSLCLCACGDTIIEVTDVTSSLKTRSNAVQSTLASAGGSAAAHPFATLAKQPSSPQKQTSKELEQRRDEDDEDADNGSNITDSNDVPTNANASLSETSSDADNAAKNATSEITIAAAGETDYEDEGDTSDDTDDDTQNATHVETGSDTDIEPPVQTEIQTDGETDVDTADGPHDTADDTLDDTDVDTNSSNVTAATNTTRTTNLTVVAISLGLPVTASAFTQPKQADFAALMSTLTGGDASIVGITEHAARRLLAANIVVDVEVTLASNQDADTVVSTLTQDTINDALSNSTLNISDATIISAPLISRRPPVDTDSDSDEDTGAGATDNEGEGDTSDDTDDDTQNATHVETGSDTDIEPPVQTEIQTDGETDVDTADGPHDTADDTLDDTDVDTNSSNVTAATNTTRTTNLTVVAISLGLPVTASAFTQPKQADFAALMSTLTGGDASIVGITEQAARRLLAANIVVDVEVTLASNQDADTVVSTLTQDTINDALSNSTLNISDATIISAPLISRRPPVDTDSDSDDDTGAGATDDDTTDDDAEGAMPGATDDETEIKTANGPHDTADDTAETQDDMDDDVSGTTPVESDAETEIEVVETEIETDGETEVQIADSPQDTAADVPDDTKKESTSNVTVATFEATDNSNTTVRVEAVVDGDETTVVLSVQFPVTEAEFSDEVREDFKVAIAALTGADPANVVILNVVTIQRRAQGNINVDFKIIVPSNLAATEVASTLSEGNINTALRASSSPVLSKMESVSVVQAPTVVVSRTPSVVSAPAVPPSPQGTPASEEEEPPPSKHVSDESDEADSADTSGVMAGAAGGAVVVLCIAGYLLHRRRSNHTHTLDSKQAPLGPGDTEAGTLLSAVPLAQPLVQVKVDQGQVKDQGFCYPVTAPTLPGPDARYRYEPQPVLHGGWGQGWNGGFAQ